MKTAKYDRKFDRNRMKDVVHYVCGFVDSADLGSTKLNKIILEIDRESYLRTGQSMTGATYERQTHGPVPRGILGIIADLKSSQSISVSEGQKGPHKIRLFDCNKSPDMSGFSGEEMALIESCANRISVYTAVAASERVHTKTWQSAEDREEIPHYAWLADGLRAPSGDSLSWAKSQIE